MINIEKEEENIKVESPKYVKLSVKKKEPELSLSKINKTKRLLLKNFEVDEKKILEIVEPIRKEEKKVFINLIDSEDSNNENERKYAK